MVFFVACRFRRGATLPNGGGVEHVRFFWYEPATYIWGREPQSRKQSQASLLSLGFLNLSPAGQTCHASDSALKLLWAACIPISPSMFVFPFLASQRCIWSILFFWTLFAKFIFTVNGNAFLMITICFQCVCAFFDGIICHHLLFMKLTEFCTGAIEISKIVQGLNMADLLPGRFFADFVHGYSSKELF